MRFLSVTLLSFLVACGNPGNNTDQEGLLSITPDTADVGAGIMVVMSEPEGYGPSYDDTAPDSYDWNLDSEALGLHYVDVTTHDNNASEATSIVNIRIVLSFISVPPYNYPATDVERI